MTLDHKYSSLLRVSMPLMVSGFIQSIVLLTDSAFLSRYDTLSFDAVGNAGLLFITCFMIMVGLGDGTQIILARRIGEKKQEQLAGVFSTALIIQFVFASLLFLGLYFGAPSLLNSISKNSIIAGLQGQFIGIRAYAFFPSCLFLIIQAYFLAKGKTWPVLFSAIVTALSNIILDYSLIFGNFGCPELGVKGAALASTLSDVIGMLSMLFLFKMDKENRLFGLGFFNGKSTKNILKVSSPLMVQGSIALGTWTLFFMMIEQRGVFELTVSQNIRSIYFLAFVPIWGFAGTTKTYVSQYLGNGKAELIPELQKRIQLLTTLFLLVTFHGAILYPELLVSWINPEEAYVEKSASILRLISMSVILYGIISVYYQTIQGSGNTFYSLCIELSTVLVYICACYLFITVFTLDIYWIWTVEYIYFGVIGLMSYLYLRNSNWKLKSI
ncbi:MAG: MATE family efflux transporter [Crocinitomicaceae bacterium]|nr:MATE family efflux transporter [Crocinitomicaceae bacterium]MDG1734667.1 MATE family efflux transporter [Crocinitomicaceae bacterium]MDG2505602.1 MATE family efflux transporter [Crocinitomicaceae bacterium]